MKLHVLSDIHGQFDQLQAIMAVIPAGEKVIFIGDYLDSHSRPDVEDGYKPLETIAWLTEAVKNPDYTFLLGNHDDFIKQTVAGNELMLDTWLYNGGRDTLALMGCQEIAPDSPGVSAFLKARFPEFVAFVQQAPLHVTQDKVDGDVDYFFVHAGVDFNKADPFTQTSDEDFLWIRDAYFGRTNTTNHVIVSGHTPLQILRPGQPAEPYYWEDGTGRWLIDGGAGIGEQPDSVAPGHINHLVLEV
jgi:serine/threonine protein phosphatase 1